MSKLLLGMIIGFFLFPLAADIVQLDGGRHDFFVVPSYGTTDALVGHCTKDIVKNGQGWVFVKRDFFVCDKINIVISNVIYGEYTHKPTEKELQALHHWQKSPKSDD
jgi:hypothetical protein